MPHDLPNVSLKGTLLDRWPARIEAKQFKVADCTCWLSKAAMRLRRGDREQYIFGFGFDRDEERSRCSAFFECLEHVLGSEAGYNTLALDDLITTYSYRHGSEIGAVNRGTLLIGAETSDGNRLTATGLAFGTSCYDGITHSCFEVIERHINYCWWFDRSLNLRVEALAHSPSQLLAVFTRRFTFGFHAISMEVCLNEPLVAVGSSFRSNLDDAVEHATSERQMLTASLATAPAIKGRHFRLVTPDFAKKVKMRAEELLHQGGDLENQWPPLDEVISSVTYGKIYEEPDFYAVRCTSELARDVPQKPFHQGTANPFL